MLSNKNQFIDKSSKAPVRHLSMLRLWRHGVAGAVCGDRLMGRGG
jgi:hypothetical protein